MVVLDVQFALLLKLNNQAGAVWWLWAERSTAQARWFDLRRAVYAKHRPTTFQDSDAAEGALGELAAKVEHPHSAPARHL